MSTVAQQKTEFLNLSAEFASQLCQLTDLGNALAGAWYLRTYQVGGAQEMTDADCAAINCTAAQVQTAINLMTQLQNLKAGSAVTASNQYDVFLENARRLTHTRWWPEADRT